MGTIALKKDPFILKKYFKCFNILFKVCLKKYKKSFVKSYNFDLLEKDFFYDVKKLFKNKRRYFNITSKHKLIFTFLKDLFKKIILKRFFWRNSSK